MKRLFTILACFVVVLVFVSSLSFANDIEPASDKQVSLIRVLLNKDVTVVGSAAVRSSEHKRAYYVGLNFTVPLPNGISRVLTGVWILGGTKDDPKQVFAVDGSAKNFSRATAADKTNPPIAYNADKGCSQLKRYLLILKQ